MKIFLLLAALWALIVPTVSSAALSCGMEGVAGYYQCHEGRLAGFLQTTDGYWLMINSPNIDDTMSLTGTVTLFPGDTSATKYVDPVLYARAGWLIDFTLTGFPPSPDAAAQLNAAIWNIFEPGSVPLYTVNGSDPWDINSAYQYLTTTTAGNNWNFQNYMWMLTTASGNEAIVLSPISPPPPTSAPSVPLPPAVWLFGSGLMGLVAIARSKRSA